MKLASVFTDHMVLQKGRPVKVFGEGEGTVTVEFLGNTVTQSFTQNEWCVVLPSFEYGGPYEMTVTLNDKKIILKDIYVGEVWLAMGQSNMEMPLFRTLYGCDEAKHAYNEKVRFFDIPRRVERDKPKYGWPFIKTDGEDTPWEVCDESSALRASAVGYYVAKELSAKLGVAIGIIGCNWGCRRLEPFISREYAHKTESLKKMLDEYNEMVKATDMDEYRKELDSMYDFIKERCAEIDYDEIERTAELGPTYTRPCPLKGYPACYKPGPNHPDGIGVLFDAMVSRIAPFGVNGVLWYQGESTHGDEYYAEKYGVFMECMMDTFKNHNMNFYTVELPGSHFLNPGFKDDAFIEDKNDRIFIREAFRRLAEKYENNHVVTTMQIVDVVESTHPLDKASIAHRMALKVLRYSYGFDIPCEEPSFESARFENGKAYIKLKNADGLMSPDLGNVRMYIADSSKCLKRAEIVIDGNTLILSNPEVKNPQYARYAFNSHYIGEHLMNNAGLPLAPFRTDK